MLRQFLRGLVIDLGVLGGIAGLIPAALILGTIQASGLGDRGELVIPALLASITVGALIAPLVLSCRPQLRSTYRRLQAFGRPSEVLAEIDRELADRGAVIWIGGPVLPLFLRGVRGRALLTTSWLLMFGQYEARMARLSDVVWVRRTAPPRGYRGSGVFLEVRMRNGAGEVFPLPDEGARQLLFELIARLPWVMVGPNDVLDREWLSARAPLLARVEEQRRQIQALPEEKRRALIDDKVMQARDGMQAPPP